MSPGSVIVLNSVYHPLRDVYNYAVESTCHYFQECVDNMFINKLIKLGRNAQNMKSVQNYGIKTGFCIFCTFYNLVLQ